MPAPNKVGLDYFSFDVDLLRDRKLRKPKMKFGYLATVVYIALLCMIYEDKGYYLDYSDKDDVIWQIIEYLQGKYTPDYDTVAEVIACLVECELFSGYHFKQGTITSRRIQRNYYSATVSRKTVDIDDCKWLLTMEEMKSLSAKHCYYQKKHSQANNGVNQANNGVNQANNPQSKLNQSKLNESILNYSKEKSKGDGGCGCYKSPISLFEEIKAAPLNEYEITRLAEIVDEYGEKWTLEALKVMADAGKCRIDYVNGILRNWKTNGRSAKPKSFKERKEEERQKMIDEWLKEESEVAENAQSGIDEAL